jgi:Tol biopolymer transport system component
MKGTRALGLAVTLVAAPVLAAPALAQYFGQNQVQYRDFDFKVLKTKRFDIYYYPEQQEKIEHVARMAERWYDRLSKVFAHDLDGRQALVFYASGSDFRQTNVVQGIGEGTGGVTEGLMRRIVMPSAGSLAETDHVLGHELVHAFQYDMSSRTRGQGFLRLPLWFVEGLAEYLSLGPVDSQTAMWLRDAAAGDKLPTLRDLGNPRFFPYRFGHAFWAYVGGVWGDETAVELLREGMRTGDPEAAIRKVLETGEKEFSQQWGEAIRKAYAGFLEAKKSPSAYGPLLVGEKRAGGDLNLGPALSPDGRRIVFLSEKDLFSVDLFLADAETGKVIRKLASTATDPHFDSLQFIESAGAWSPDGKLFVQSALRRGHAALFVVDPETGGKVHEAEFVDLSELQSPSFAPDGRRVVFSALQGGLLDLWTYDLASGERQRLTRDAFAELHPVFSPDGRKVAFTTDRFSTRLDALEFGNYRLGLLDVASGAVEELPGYAGARHSNPQWSPDGASLLFLSDADGATNVHRLELATGERRQVTDLRTGVAGISPLSPSLTVASGTGRIAYTAREDGRYRIYAIDDAAKREGRASERAALDEGLVLLPPRTRPAEGQVEKLLADATSGLPAPDFAPAEPYRPRLGLQYVGQPSIGLGVDRFGGYVGGSTALYFSDVLGNRNLSAAASVYGSIQDTSGQLVYSNLTKRIDWGVGAQYAPYRYAGGIFRSLQVVEGTPVIADQYLVQRETDASAFAVAAYPLDRARRFELQGSFRRVGFSQELRTEYYSPVDGSFLGDEKEKLRGVFDPLYLGSVSGAFVHDTSVFGATSPILGSRARFEVAPTFGSIDYTEVLADWRAYLMPVRPVTFALRATHFGRYGSGGDDGRFQDIYLGYPELVRGYDDIGAEECVPDETSSCPLYDRLFGSRVLVASAELRAPLWGLFKGRLSYGPLPIEIALFADAGVAWTGSEKASFLGGDRSLLTSVGAALRGNVFGFLVAQISAAKPLDRPGRSGWVWQWSLSPGF